ncbi:MAG: alkaline phosphatase D family protein [Acidobacteriota bacterium]|nr:alkaline phosphatase D family protein [Acidobacteriota bacterium]
MNDEVNDDTPGRIDRRTFFRRSLSAGAIAVALKTGAGTTTAWAGQAPAIIPAASSRVAIPQGVASGDVTAGRAVIWSRADRAARMFVEYSTTERFDRPLRVPGPAALETTDFTGRVVLDGLPPGQRIFYRVLFQDLADIRQWSLPLQGSLITPAAAGATRNVTLAWSADTVGQGWGINPEWGGLRLYETMRAAQPDVFIHCGDTIYADQPLVAEVKLDDGSIWKNIVTEAKSKAAETLDEFRGNYQYNLLDDHMRRFNAEVSQVVMWDDHEVRDNWYWERDLSRDDRYTVKSAALLAARARRAFLEYQPITPDASDPERIHRVVPYGPLVDIFALDLRSYRGANSENLQTVLDKKSALFGASQLATLKARLAASRATWKVIASDLPIGVVVRDGPTFYEAVANGEPGAPLGRELEIANLLRFIRDQKIRNVVWVTADVHYCAAHHYDPSRAVFTEFDPFWEFVAGPLNAGTFAPNAMDKTFGPEVKFTGTSASTKPNRPPSDSLQFFGTMTIDARTRAITVALRNLAGKVLYSVELPPR